MPSNMIKYVGLGDLSVDEQQTLKRIIQQESVKVTRATKAPVNLMVKVNVHKNAGKRKRYTIHVKASTRQGVFNAKTGEKPSKNSGDWDLTTAAHKAIEKLAAETEHRLQSSTAKWKKRGVREFIRKWFTE